ncbi:cytochrome ubiquinol oxidase subunit I [Ancylobacter sp. TS-1]|uniref:cytochrome ubiquinol oxidase subunit I n=1 Tax=Ancylobacter sp. TS-1 TaxID=1850374 RepID=UPI001265AC99|nr:cytochrome ubiquinol oxidase subunit I [Ancylobacter sp. TS-1]QFR34419.1 cytochrome bd-I ubiquinol oxidase subunit CydA [Ancylobacter sp. TS-1]
MVNDLVVDLSRLQFAATALYHFLFVPLTLGLTVLLAVMETVYVTTGREIYKQATQFWTKLLLINFALGVATGLTMEFQFGTNWSFYSSFVGDTFGAPLAIEGLMAFFMESTFIGLMVFGWDRLSKAQHLFVTYLVALGSNFSALWILVANSFMQHPQGAVFNPVTMRMELDSFGALFFNPDAQAKFVHTVLAGYVTAAIFVCGVSAWYMLRGRHLEFARRSFRVAAVFGMLGSAGVITLGDALGYVGAHVQPTKLAAMEALWEAEPAPMPFNAIAFPNQEEQRNDFAIQVPWVLSLLVTHSLSGTVPAIDQLEAQAKDRIRNGIPAVQAMEKLSANPKDAAALAQFDAHSKDVGYGFLVQRYAQNGDLSTVTDADIARAARDTIPEVWIVFWAFRAMVGFGLLMLAYMVLAALMSLTNQVERSPWFLRGAVAMIAVPFLACEAGWLVAEVGRQPWSVYEMLPTWLSASTHSTAYMIFSISGFVLLYTIFAVVEMFLMVHFIRKGPEEHGTSGAAKLAGAY